MNKKLWIGTIAVFIGISVLGFLIHGVILKPVYQSDMMMKILRPEAEENGLMWIYFVVDAIVAFFFTLIFSKGYEGKGMMEGVRYGLYVGLLMSTPAAYASYAMYPMPYALALHWFLLGIVEYIILGIILAMVFGKKAQAAPAA